MTDKKLLSKRVNFPSIGGLLDDWVPRFATHFKFDEKQTQEFQEGVTKLFEYFLGDAWFATRLGAEKGIAEAFEMMKDPAYHETVKKRKQAERERLHAQFGTPAERKARQKEAEAEADRRRNNPTHEEKVSDICQAIREMGYVRKRYNQHKKRIARYTEEEGGEIVVEAFKRMTNIDENLWFADFDVDAFVRALSESEIDRPEKIENPSPVDDLEDFFDKHSDLDED